MLYGVFLLFHEKVKLVTSFIGARRGVQPGAVAPPLEFENDDVICCSRGKYPKIFIIGGVAPPDPMKIFLWLRALMYKPKFLLYFLDPKLYAPD